MREVSREWLEFLREQYPKGSRVRLTKMGNDPHPIPPGSMGTLKYIDDVGQFHVKWDNGRGLALIIGEDQFQILPPEPQTIKFYMPLTAQLYAYDDWGDLEEYGNDLDGSELRDYQSCIHEALLENQMPEEKNRGLMHWYDKPDGVNTKVQSVMLDVESRDGQLWGVAECKVNGTLLPEEKEALAEYISGQASDGWGEGFEQRAIKLNDGELYVSLWNSSNWSIQTEEERFSPDSLTRLPDLCWSVLPGEGTLICIKRGESGYALASGMSFLCTDTKGDLYRNYAGIAKDFYGYQIAVLDLRNPTRSDGNNLLHLINKYMDIYKANPNDLAAKAKAEKYSKILAKTLINTSGGDSAQYGQNAFFYDSAEGLLTAMFLLVAEYLPTEDENGNPVEKRHIVSVFKLVQELLAPSKVKGKNQFQILLEKLPPNHKARWFAGSALNTAEQAMASVISTVLSRLNAFLDSEMEQILCFDTAIDAEKFCNEKSAIFIVLPEEDQTKYFMVSLILQNLYREILTVADENGGRLKNRVVFFADELGTCPPIQSLELMFSASRSRGLMLVPIVQSITGQLKKNYGAEGAEVIVDNCQVNLYGGFAPASQTAVELSKALGSRTVMSGSTASLGSTQNCSLTMLGAGNPAPLQM